jgi:hypothetical protein
MNVMTNVLAGKLAVNLGVTLVRGVFKTKTIYGD